MFFFFFLGDGDEWDALFLITLIFSRANVAFQYHRIKYERASIIYIYKSQFEMEQRRTIPFIVEWYYNNNNIIYVYILCIGHENKLYTIFFYMKYLYHSVQTITRYMYVHNTHLSTTASTQVNCSQYRIKCLPIVFIIFFYWNISSRL